MKHYLETKLMLFLKHKKLRPTISLFGILVTVLSQSAPANEDFDFIASEFKNELAELKKSAPKDYKIFRISPILGVEGFVSEYKVSFGLPGSDKHSCQKKIKGVKIKEKEFMVKHQSRAEPDDPTAFTLTNPVLINVKFPSDLSKALVPSGGPDVACFRDKPFVWSDTFTISNVSDDTGYYIAVPENTKIQVRAVMEVSGQVLKESGDGLDIADMN